MAYLRGVKRKLVKEEDRRVIKGDLDIEKLKTAYTDLEGAFRLLKESQIEVILNLAIVAEYKDSDTGHHILRISDYATELAVAIGLSEEQIEVLRYASTMHDIGKVGIPDKILQKPGKLDPDEWELMKQHTQIGYRMFKNSQSPVLRAASEIAHSHHEKFDGSGYPKGLKGEAIPLYGRVVAIVDAFDAIISKRLYKQKRPFEEGIAAIVADSDKHFDPKLVEAFKKSESNIRKIYEANVTIQQYVEEGGTLSPGLLSLES